MKALALIRQVFLSFLVHDQVSSMRVRVSDAGAPRLRVCKSATRDVFSFHTPPEQNALQQAPRFDLDHSKQSRSFNREPELNIFAQICCCDTQNQKEQHSTIIRTQQKKMFQFDRQVTHPEEQTHDLQLVVKVVERWRVSLETLARADSPNNIENLVGRIIRVAL